MARVLLRIDRNGTKYWGDDTCPRCGGQGSRSEWYRTGFTCFECGGTGMTKLRLEKEYTPEYAATLQARRDEREAKKLGYASAEAMKAARLAEAERREAELKAKKEAEEAARKVAEEAEAKRKAISQYVGTPGEKLVTDAVYEGSPYFTRHNAFGYPEKCFIHRFRDPAGNLIIWRTGAGLQLEEGCAVTLKATVKEHSEYKGEKQTFVLRAKIEKEGAA